MTRRAIAIRLATGVGLLGALVLGLLIAAAWVSSTDLSGKLAITGAIVGFGGALVGVVVAAILAEAA